jgi:hypothetical protein
MSQGLITNAKYNEITKASFMKSINFIKIILLKKKTWQRTARL